MLSVSDFDCEIVIGGFMIQKLISVYLRALHTKINQLETGTKSFGSRK